MKNISGLQFFQLSCLGYWINLSQTSEARLFKLRKSFWNWENIVAFQEGHVPINPLQFVTFPPGGGGVLPYITYTGMCRSTGSWFWSSWFRTGYPFQRRFLERGIIFRTQESSSFVSSHLKLFKDRLLLKIRFNALTSKLLYSCCTLERSIKDWPISRTGYQF